MKRAFLFVALILAVALLPARAQGPDDQYVRVYNLMQQADTLNNSDQPAAALAKYLEAQSGLQRLQKAYPDWNPKVVSFRLNYLASKISAVSARVPTPVPVPIAASKPPTTTLPVTAPPAQPLPPADFERQLNSLQDEVRQLQADKILLEMKLKEALATQPATVDPRELAKAQERIQSLLKENELLKTAPAPDPKALDEVRTQLAEANRKLDDQTERANALAVEKRVLQNRLDSLAPTVENVAQFDRIKEARDDAERKLADQTRLAAKLTAEKETLLARIQTLTPGAEAVEALRAENQILKKQLADAKTSSDRSDDLSRQLAQAQARVAALQSDAEILRLEKIALENRVKTLSASPPIATAPPPSVSRAEDLRRIQLLEAERADLARRLAAAAASAPAASRAEDLRRIKLLEAERTDLAKRLDAANKELGSRRSRTASTRAGDMSNQIAALRARLDVFEARAVPYTAEELALFQKPAPALQPLEATVARKSAKELPRAAAALVAEAQRDYAARRLDQAEEKFLEVLRQDDSNAYTLANLAAIQLERSKVDEAEKNVQQALAADPNNSHALMILGLVRFHQAKYDEALDPLSRAAKLDPNNAEIQNHLGVVLSHKGLRVPAETALRKAIQLEPGYGSAHNNLAVIYGTQTPPLIELARWHYERALAVGHPRNAMLDKLFETRAAAANPP